jgi:hypothetical protein
MKGYTLNLDVICKNQSFSAAQVVSSDLVFPRGAVPNAQLLWVRIELDSGERKFITLSLGKFYEYVQLPESSIGGWTDGDRGSDYSGLNSRYEVDHSGSSEALPDELQLGTESAEATVESGVAESSQGGATTGV